LASIKNGDQIELIKIFSSPRNPVNSSTEAVKVDLTDLYSEWYITALLASGFRRIPVNRTDYSLFLPCPLGTFSNSSSRGKQGCIECPPGILLSVLGNVFTD